VNPTPKREQNSRFLLYNGLNASLALKEKILATTTPYGGRPGSYRPDDTLLAFLNSL
jgi:hypothetical protein